MVHLGRLRSRRGGLCCPPPSEAPRDFSSSDLAKTIERLYDFFMLNTNPHDLIRVQGAREHNLRDISVSIPKRKLTVFTGVSGSGKSSLVFDTIAAEGQRLINETYSSFVQGFMPSLNRPDVDHLDGITAAIIVDQERMGANARSTVGTATDANALLRVLFSRLGTPSAGPAYRYGFNDPAGACPACEGSGRTNELDLSVIIDESKSLEDGAILVPGYTADGWAVKTYKDSGFVDPTKVIAAYNDQERHDLLYKETCKVKIADINMTYDGLIPRLQKSIFAKDKDSLQPHLRAFVERAATFADCPNCGGTRLNPTVLASQIDGVNIADACAMQISDLAQWVRGINEPSVAPVVATLQQVLDSFAEIGLGYLSLSRSSGSLSGGEAQRTKLVKHLGSALTDATYVFDEPSTGLHPHDIQRMNGLLCQLRDKGNTVLVVEHKPEVIAIADWVVDLGPGGGPHGGQVCFEGTVDQLKAADTLTGRHLAYRSSLKPSVRATKDLLEVRGAKRHNLKDVDVDIPLGVLCVVTGVAGSGKSSLIHGSIPKGEGIVTVDQAPIRGSRRSNPATYTGLADPIRKAFAKANGVKPGMFSANSAGACPNCSGNGVIYTDLAMMAGVATVCEACNGQRFQDEVLALTLADRNIAEVLAMSVEEALAFFKEGPAKIPAAQKILSRMMDVGLGYISLGQPLTTLSGGERQRLKLAIEMANDGGVYVLDEPTSGLHLADIAKLLDLLDLLVDQGKSIIVIEHHLAVVAHADWVIDLGPGAGQDGGQVVFTGTPADLAKTGTLTGQALAAYLID